MCSGNINDVILLFPSVVCNLNYPLLDWPLWPVKFQVLLPVSACHSAIPARVQEPKLWNTIVANFNVWNAYEIDPQCNKQTQGQFIAIKDCCQRHSRSVAIGGSFPELFHETQKKREFCRGQRNPLCPSCALIQKNYKGKQIPVFHQLLIGLQWLHGKLEPCNSPWDSAAGLLCFVPIPSKRVVERVPPWVRWYNKIQLGRICLGSFFLMENRWEVTHNILIYSICILHVL